MFLNLNGKNGACVVDRHDTGLSGYTLKVRNKNCKIDIENPLINRFLSQIHNLNFSKNIRSHTSEAQAKLPFSRRRARNFLFPPRVRTVLTLTEGILSK